MADVLIQEEEEEEENVAGDGKKNGKATATNILPAEFHNVRFVVKIVSRLQPWHPHDVQCACTCPTRGTTTTTSKRQRAVRNKNVHDDERRRRRLVCVTKWHNRKIFPPQAWVLISLYYVLLHSTLVVATWCGCRDFALAFVPTTRITVFSRQCHGGVTSALSSPSAIQPTMNDPTNNNNNNTLSSPSISRTSSSSSSKSEIQPQQQQPEQVDFVDRSSYWVYMYYLLMVFKEREGHTAIPVAHVEKGWQLGMWLSDQRRLYKRQQLHPEEQQRLEMAGIEWDLQELHWNVMYQQLQAFVLEQGHAHVPQRYKTTTTTMKTNNTNLGTWLTTQRAAYRHGKMVPARQAKLEALGVAWNQQEAKWNHMYHLLQSFAQKHGHVQVPLKYVVVQDDGTEYPLGAWLTTQRKYIKNNTLKSDRNEKLQQLGVEVSSSSQPSSTTP